MKTRRFYFGFVRALGIILVLAAIFTGLKAPITDFVGMLLIHPSTLASWATCLLSLGGISLYVYGWRGEIRAAHKSFKKRLKAKRKSTLERSWDNSAQSMQVPRHAN